MKRYKGILLSGILAVVASLGSGCNQDKVLEKQKEIDRLNVIKMNYEKDVQSLMRQVDDLKVSSAQNREELNGKDRQIELLMEELKNQPVATSGAKMTPDQSQRIRYIAEEVGGELIGNRILLPGDFLFSSGSWALTSGAKSTLKRISQVLEPEAMGLVLKIVGHTDNEPIKRLKRKGIESNRQLSVKRSLSVLNYLKDYCKYPAELMYPTGWGALDPVSSNKAAAGRKRNRRVEIFIDSDLSNLTSNTGITEVKPMTGGAIRALPMDQGAVEEESVRKPPARFMK